MEYQHDPELVAAELKHYMATGTEPMPGAAQHELDLEAWREFFLEYIISGCVELGTGTGAFSNFLELNVGRLITIDSAHPGREVKGFYQTDVFENSTMIAATITSMQRPFILYCDNGDKPREVEIFSPFLRQGDFLATHDFQIEIQPKDIPSEFKLLFNKGLTAFYVKT